ncbi:unnamed protein product, partial [Vitis vinifera]
MYCFLVLFFFFFLTHLE